MPLLPGAAEAVDAVAAVGGRSVVVTAKHEPNARKCLAHVGVDVDVVVGSRWGPAKATTLTEHGAIAYIGDTPGDMAAALASGAIAVGVTSGPHSADELRDAGAELLLETLHPVPARLREWRQAR